MELSFFIDREDAKKVEEEERKKFVKDVILNIGISLDDVWPNDDLDIEEKIELRKLLAKYNILILDSGDRELEIYVDKDLIARWEKPKFKLCFDNTELDPSKRIFLEMTINCFSIFDEENQVED